MSKLNKNNSKGLPKSSVVDSKPNFKEETPKLQLRQRFEGSAYAPGTIVPGLSYVPDLLEIEENEHLMTKVIAEFIDFLDCITDLLQLLLNVKNKHLVSPVPLPHAVIREIKVFKDKKGPRMKQFERELIGVHGSASIDLLLGTRSSQHQDKKIKSQIPIKVEIQTKIRDVRKELQDVIGKRTKPLWQIALKDGKKTLTASELSILEANARIVQRFELKKKKDASVFRTKSETLMDTLKNPAQLNIQPTTDRAAEQIKMLSAYFAGFTSVKDHQSYLLSLKPHWFTDLLKKTISGGILVHQKIIKSFEKLSKFFDYDFKEDHFAKARLCFIIQSLPIWDVTRMTLQRATEFILYDILSVEECRQVLVEWLNVRRLPYVVMPQVLGGQSTQSGDISFGQFGEDKTEFRP